VNRTTLALLAFLVAALALAAIRAMPIEVWVGLKGEWR
jgi:hypothetical protein